MFDAEGLSSPDMDRLSTSSTKARESGRPPQIRRRALINRLRIEHLGRSDDIVRNMELQPASVLRTFDRWGNLSQVELFNESDEPTKVKMFLGEGVNCIFGRSRAS